MTHKLEEAREIWLARWLRDFVYDLRFSARSFLRSPAFAATAVLSLALGIGATTAIYSLVDQVVLRALPVDHPERLVLIDWEGLQVGGGFGSYNLMSYRSVATCSSRNNSSTAYCAALPPPSTSRRAANPGRPPLNLYRVPTFPHSE